MVASLLFDTNIVIDILAGVTDARKQYEGCTNPAISIITWMEVMVGVQPDEEAKVIGFLATFVQFPLSPSVATKAIEVRRISRLKLPDAIVLATALVEGRTLLTRNTKDFQPDTPNIRIRYRL